MEATRFSETSVTIKCHNSKDDNRHTHPIKDLTSKKFRSLHMYAMNIIMRIRWA
jgi:hypothetical protein